jgi:hypothetical protein
MTRPTRRAPARAWIAEHDPLPVVGRSAVGYAVDGAYAENYWLPVVGPSALWALRRLVRMVRTPSGLWLPLGPFACSLGLGAGTGASSPIVHCLDRLVQFRLAQVVDGVYTVSVAVPDLHERQRRRLPAHLLATIDADADAEAAA